MKNRFFFFWADEHFHSLVCVTKKYEPQSEIKSVYCLFLSAARDYKSSTAILVGFLWSWSTLLCSLRNWKQLSNTTTAQDIWLPYEWFTVTGDSRTCGNQMLLAAAAAGEYQKGRAAFWYVRLSGFLLPLNSQYFKPFLVWEPWVES